jgi:hypothetical protein
MVFGLIVTWIGMLGGLFYALPFSRYVFPGPAVLNYLSSVLLFLVVAIPTIFAVLILIRFLTKYSAPRNIRRSLGGLWLFSACAAVLFGLSMGKAMSVEEQYTESTIIETAKDTVIVDVNPNPYSSSWRRFDNLFIGEEGLYLDRASFGFKKSPDGQFRVERVLSARGKSVKAAKRNLNAIVAELEIRNNHLSLNDFVFLPKRSKVRDQRVNYIIYIPEGKYVHIDGHLTRLSSLQLRPNTKHPDDMGKHVWLMTDEGLISPAFVDQYNYQKSSDLTEFNEMRIDGRFDVSIRKDSDHKIRLTGKKEYVDDVKIEKVNDVLLIEYEGNYSSVPVKIEIALPILNEVVAKDLHELSLYGFNQDQLRLNATGTTDINAVLDVSELYLTKSGRGDIELKGKGRLIDAHLRRGATIDATQFKVRTAYIHGEDYWRVYLPEIDTLFTVERNLRNIRYEGRKPEIIIDAD